MHRDMLSQMSPQEREMYVQVKRGVQALQSGGPNALGRCTPAQLPPPQLDGNGCPIQGKFCRTPIPVNVSVPANSVPITIDIETSADVAFLFELRSFTIPAAASAGTTLISSLKVGAREYFPDGPIPVENFALDYEGANLLPQRVRITSSIPAKLTLLNSLAAVFQYVATFETDQLRD